MQKRLRIRFVTSALLALTCVMLVIIGLMNVLNYSSVITRADRTLSFLAENGGRFPDHGGRPIHPGLSGSPELPYETRFFTVVTDGDGRAVEISTASIAAIREEEALEMSLSVISSGAGSGFSGSYRFLVSESEDGTRVTFLDCGRHLSTANTFLFWSIAAAIVGILSVAVLLILISGRVVKPICDSYEKQKQFITNAGHDLKTPLTVIDADAELIGLELGESEWLDDIRRQTRRLATLTENLIYLSRMEEDPRIECRELDLSELVLEEAESFSAVATSSGKELAPSVTPHVRISGNEGDLIKLLSVLLDNAVKYASEGGRIDVTLDRVGRSARLAISNPADGVTEESVKMMFERFYRGDSSRSSRGGFGIGLSMAAAIVTAHRGRISAECVDGVLTVTVLLPTDS